ncbi:MAG: hypothetical protein PHF60_04460 [Candidatus ainarchaeum sp.]|nr:hypothetical protein [Candidatus ainarchaeum sp.]
MKRLILILVLSTLLFAQSSGQGSIKDALDELQGTIDAFLGVMVMLSIVASGPLALIAVAIYFLMVKGKEKPGIWKIAMLVFAALAILAIAAGILGAIIYVLSPVLIKSLVAP